MDFEIELPLFKGPFDLLLFFIERDELDIYDIPISSITKDFLHYIEHLEKLNIEIASEFILVAASLMRVKAKMLIPRADEDDEGNEVDPRKELVQRLLEYKKYKSVVIDFSDFEEIRSKKAPRGNIKKELNILAEKNNIEVELQDIDLYKLLKIFRHSIEKFELNIENTQHNITPYPFTIEQQKEQLLDNIDKNKKLSFEEIIKANPLKVAVIFNFLAILELLQLGFITIKVGEGFNNFWLTRNSENSASI